MFKHCQLVFAALLLLLSLVACGGLKAPVSPKVETVNVGLKGNLIFNMPLPDWLKAKAAKVAAMGGEGMPSVSMLSVYVEINQPSNNFGFTLNLDIDSTKTMAKGSASVEPAPTTVQAFYQDKGRVLYQSDKVYINIERDKIYQVSLTMQGRPEAQISFNVVWKKENPAVETLAIKADAIATKLHVEANQSFIWKEYAKPGETIFLAAADLYSTGGSTFFSGVSVRRIGGNDGILDSLMVSEIVGGKVKDLKILTGSTIFSEEKLSVPVEVLVNAEVRTIFFRGHISQKTLENQSFGLEITGFQTVGPVVIVGQMPIFSRYYFIGSPSVGDGGGKG